MDVAGSYTFDAPQTMLWEALLDPNVLGAIMPGGKGFAQTGDYQYSGVLEVKVGPVQGTFQGLITLSDIVAPDSYHIVVDGKGAAGFIKGSGRLQLEARDPQTEMQYTGTAQVGGRIASVGQRLMDSAARSIIRQSLDALNEYLKLEVAQQAATPATPEPAPAAEPAAEPTPIALVETHAPAVSPTTHAALVPLPAYKPPSQTALGLHVARDVLDDMLPGGYQPWLFAALIIVAVLIVMFAAGHA